MDDDDDDDDESFQHRGVDVTTATTTTAAAATTTSKQGAGESDEPWLQLRIGSAPPEPGLFSGDRWRGFRVVSPPRRPEAGVWLMLQAAQNQGRRPFLPQISKSYLRIKDGSMSVGLLMKYLVSKLGLQHESQVVIACRGQVLLPLLTLEHVRDNIWWPNDKIITLSVDSSTIHQHLMTLEYSRSIQPW